MSAGGLNHSAEWPQEARFGLLWGSPGVGVTLEVLLPSPPWGQMSKNQMSQRKCSKRQRSRGESDTWQPKSQCTSGPVESGSQISEYSCIMGPNSPNESCLWSRCIFPKFARLRNKSLGIGLGSVSGSSSPRVSFFLPLVRGI